MSYYLKMTKFLMRQENRPSLHVISILHTYTYIHNIRNSYISLPMTTPPTVGRWFTLLKRMTPHVCWPVIHPVMMTMTAASGEMHSAILGADSFHFTSSCFGIPMTNTVTLLSAPPGASHTELNDFFRYSADTTVPDKLPLTKQEHARGTTTN